MEIYFVREIVFILLMALFTAFVAYKFKQPTVLGYLFGGVVLSLPIFKSIVSTDVSQTLAQIGVALLLFTTGIEFPISKLLELKKGIIFGSVIQVFLFIIISTIMLPLLGLTSYEAFFISGAFSNSATVIVLELLDRSFKFDTAINEMIVGWLVMQDIIMVVLAILLKSFAGDTDLQFFLIGKSLVISLSFIFSTFILGKTIIPKIFETFTTKAPLELLLIFSFTFCMLVAYVAEIIGLSYTMGAFLAGVMISESFVNHEIFSEMRPIRDLFMVIFYVTLGSLVSMSFFLSSFVQVVTILVCLMICKLIISYIVILFFEKQTRKAFIASLTLAQGGEFAFVFSQMGLENEWIDKDFFSLVIIVNILSLFFTPYLIKQSRDWYIKIRDLIKANSPFLYKYIFDTFDRVVDVDHPDITNHVVICGIGRVGSYVARTLQKMNIPFIVIDSNTEIIDYCKKRGIKYLFGDASNIDILEAADVERAKAVVIALPQEGAAEIIATNTRELNPTIKIIARSHEPTDDKRLKDKGVMITVEPEFEAAVSISKKLLDVLGRKSEIRDFLKKSRRRQRSKMS